MSSVQIKDANDATQRVDTIQRTDGGNTVETQAVAVINPATGDPLLPSAAGALPVTGTFWQATQPVSAASLPLPTGAATESTLSALNGKVTAVNTGAVVVSSSALPTGAATETTLAAINTKTPALGSAAPAAASPVVLAQAVTVGAEASVAALNVDLLTGGASGWFDARDYRSASIQIVGAAGISAGAIFFEQTNDTTAAAAGNPWPVEEDDQVTPAPNVVAVTIAASTTRIFVGKITSRFVRVRVSTAFVGGTVQAIGVFLQQPYSRTTQTVVQSVAARLNATVSGTVTANIGTGALAAGTNAIGDVGIQYRASATGAASFVSVQSPATPAAGTIKASAGRVLGWQLQNSSAGLRSVKVFGVAAPTLGTTAALFEIDIPAGGRSEIHFPGGLAFGTAATFSVTSAKGLTDNTATGLAVNDVSGAFFFA